MDEDKIRELSYHEAGHPVAHHLLHSKFEFVVLERDSDAWQTCTSGRWQPPVNAQDRESQMVVALAGDVAAALFDYVTASPGDAPRVAKLVAHLDLADAAGHVDSMKTRARLLLDTPECRGAIKALADHFFREAPRAEDDHPRCLVPYIEIVAIIDEALNRGPA